VKGTEGYTKGDTTEILNLVEQHRPRDKLDWGKLVVYYNDYASKNWRAQRDWERIKKKYMTLVNNKKSQDENCMRAKQIHKELEREGGVTGKGLSGAAVLKQEGYSSGAADSSNNAANNFAQGAAREYDTQPLLSQFIQQQERSLIEFTEALEQQSQHLNAQCTLQQQQHQSSMISMMRQYSAGLASMPLAEQLSKSLAADGDWGLHDNAPANSHAVHTEGLLVESWLGSLSEDVLAPEGKAMLLTRTQEHGVVTVAQLVDVLDAFPDELHNLLGLGARELEQLFSPTLAGKFSLPATQTN
jgi:hypothetical protein